MAYQVLARKWRPQDFSSLVGQEPLVTALRNALTDGRIAQAYIFSGIRGVGKTTAARVFAKALNCERGPAADPCNDCTICRDITSGHDMDVIEVDAATYSKVEQVRELTESLRYGPARDRYKVVVLDEVHRLSRQAFDALLKIVEEPPEHLVFIFATTALDAVPATILSRCQELQFRRVPANILVRHLRNICEAEAIDTTDTALRWIARAGEGSVRDSVALLDQFATFGGGKIDEQDAKQLLGGFDTETFHRLLDAILAGDSLTVSALVREIEDHGWDPGHVYSQFLLYTRDALHLAMGKETSTVDLPAEEAQALAALVSGMAQENLLRLLQLLLSSEALVKRSEFGHLALEIAWLRAAELPKLTRIEDIFSGRATVALPPESKIPTSGADEPPPRATSPHPSSQRPSTGKAEPAGAQRPPAASESTRDDGGAKDEKLSVFFSTLRSRRQSLAAFFRDAHLEFRDGGLLIHAPPGDHLLKEALERPKNEALLREVLDQVWGPELAWKLKLAPAAPASATDKPAAASRPDPSAAKSKPAAVASQSASSGSGDALQRAREHPSVQAVLDIFNGTIESTQPGPTKESQNP